MHGEFSVMGLYLLLAIAVLFSTIMVTIGRRVPAHLRVLIPMNHDG